MNGKVYAEGEAVPEISDDCQKDMLSDGRNDHFVPILIQNILIRLKGNQILFTKLFNGL